ncbi:hypothetical protein ADIMK_3346 [Marinobacterium lacunae]|uniref:Uncharacterized protein n=1 Tax=Marinobacterium lacunae TaxID=1232683 RepID=A0A081FVA0_9GAMM|nr:hypothetical protein [Marinobacterium lacunae]KEA62455.1 hypothetical protein ADIMK_3346 [Marinobacterium lacunae]MBR9882233.1 hypothetical protein [Oceanospirillales bacterium]
MKKFTLHLDAAVVILLLFLVAFGLNLYQYSKYKELKDENFRLQIQGVEDRMNLDSLRYTLKNLKQKLDAKEQAGGAE